MARISGYAVKLILPTLLDSLDDKRKYQIRRQKSCSFHSINLQNGDPRKGPLTSWSVRVTINVWLPADRKAQGNMAYLAPRQLAISLPVIVPRLTDVLTDTHTQVRSAANGSLKRFGEVSCPCEHGVSSAAKSTLRLLQILKFNKYNLFCWMLSSILPRRHCELWTP